MRLPTIIVSIFLSLVAFDLNLTRRRRIGFASSEIGISLELGSEFKQDQKRFKKHKFDPTPFIDRKFKRPVRSKCNYFSTKPRDHRYSDQRKIRRMFSNL